MLYYKGDVSPKQSWDILENSDALLIDVRTKEELYFVGSPSLEQLGKKLIHLELQALPNMAMNPHFIEQLLEVAPDKSRPLLFICRTGVRSQQAANIAAEMGYVAYNIAEGFEGELNAQGHRGSKGGWKFCGLPWRQN